jgi:hypothetical protein
MMTLEDIQQATVNPLIAREAYDHAAQRLADTLDTKKTFEQKAFTLFSGYLTVTLALFGAGAAIYGDSELKYLFVPLWTAGTFLLIGTFCFLWALKDKAYGAIASHPDMWLNAGTIDGPDEVLPKMLPYITYYHRERIDTSVTMNENKAQWISRGIYLGIVTPLIFAVLTLVFRLR